MIKRRTSDNALSDIECGRHLGRFCLHTVVISAAVGYDSRDDSRRARALRTPSRPRLGVAERVVSREFRGRGALFRRRGARRARSRRPVGSALGGRLAPPPRPEKRRRGGGKPAQPARGRGGAARRGRARQIRPGSRPRGTGLFCIPDALQSGRTVPPRAALHRRRRLAGAARSAKGGRARRRASGGGGARPTGPGRRGRGG